VTNPTVSIIMPAYNAADYLSQSIKSVLQQTFEDWELLIVNDGSTDTTAEIAAQFADARIHYIYQQNKGLPGARNTGIKQAKGKNLCFLDADDCYHPNKLLLQVQFLEQNRGIGLVYSSRIDMDRDGNCLSLRQAPQQVTLTDLVLGYPFVINDVMVRTEWISKVAGFDETFLFNSEDRDFYLRLAQAGCQFAGQHHFLTYRRFHAGRQFRNIPAKMDNYFRALDIAFKDPLCPEEVLALRNLAYAHHYLIWGYQAAVQNEEDIAQSYLQRAIALQPALLDDKAGAIGRYLSHASSRDGGDPTPPLDRFFANMPAELAMLMPQKETVIGRAYLLRGVQELLWGRLRSGIANVARATARQVKLDKPLWHLINDQIFQYQIVFGIEAADRAMAAILSHLTQLTTAKEIRRFRATRSFNQAVHYYKAGAFQLVPRRVIGAVFYNPRYVGNKGTLAMLMRSLMAGPRYRNFVI
jgi:glycosyltransferase involved in cell wall biosynthesis